MPKPTTKLGTKLGGEVYGLELWHWFAILAGIGIFVAYYKRESGFL